MEYLGLYGREMSLRSKFFGIIDEFSIDILSFSFELIIEQSGIDILIAHMFMDEDAVESLIDSEQHEEKLDLIEQCRLEQFYD